MNIYLFIIVALIFTNICHAQTKIQGTVTDEKKQILSGSSVVLLTASDSSLVESILSDKAGAFVFQVNDPGRYLIAISYTGCKDLFLEVMAVANNMVQLGVLVLFKESHELQEITVIGRRPYLEQQIDRTVVNVKSSISNIGGSVLEVLEKSPGMRVDYNNNALIMAGKSGVKVMVNGKLSYLSESALIDMLRGIQAPSVDRIELITTPPAKYDAEGNAGYINIVLNQNPDEGFNGNYFLTAGAFEGTYFATGTDMNWRKKKVNIYGSLGGSRNAQLQTFRTYRSIINNNVETETSILSNRDPYQLNFNARLGMDLQVTPKTVIGFLVSGYNNRWHMHAKNNSKTYNDGSLDSIVNIGNTETNHWKNEMGNINLQSKLNENATIVFNADYLHYYNVNPTDYDNDFFDGQGAFLKSTVTKSSKETDIKILPIQLDYLFKIKKSQWEAGVKSTRSSFTNDVFVAEKIQDTWHTDDEFTGVYYLKENIHAAYISGTFSGNEKNQFKAGLRYEYTTTKLDRDKVKNLVYRKYGDIFPSAYWSHSINKNDKINFSYSRRITRPTFNNLAPFLIFFDPNTFISGNANLKPATTDALKLDYVHKGYSFSLSYSYEKNSIGNFQEEVIPAENRILIIAQNLDYTQTINVTVNLPFPVTKFWYSFITLGGNYQWARADFTGHEQKASLFNYSVAGAQTFTLPAKFSVELSGFYNSSTFWGISILKPMGKLSMAVQKKFKNSSLKFLVDDVFSTMALQFKSDDPEIPFHGISNLRISSRIFKLTYTASFGNRILKQKRDRTTASEEERKRVTQ